MENVEKCSRCGESHQGLEARPLTKQIVLPPHCLTHWATCPKTGEPILFIDSTVAHTTFVAREPHQQDIDALAYFLWENEGCPHGRDLEHHLRAKATLTTYYHVPSIRYVMQHATTEFLANDILKIMNRRHERMDRMVMEVLDTGSPGD